MNSLNKNEVQSVIELRRKHQHIIQLYLFNSNPNENEIRKHSKLANLSLLGVFHKRMNCSNVNV